MAPLLIDSKDLVKFGLISVLLAIVVFAGGFLSGYNQAATFYLAGNTIQTLSLPEKAMNNEDVAELQLPEIIEAGEEIDVDQPAELTEKNFSISDTAASPVITGVKQNSGIDSEEKSDIQSLTVTASESEVNNKFAAIKTVKAETVVSEASSNKLSAESSAKPLAKKKDDTVIIIANKMVASDTFKTAEFTSEELKEIKYSIQVGMYGRLINAENMMQMLQAQRLDAYITDYVNKKNEIRYNVRFGYFSDKKSAVNKLKTFKNKQKGDGYLVKFTSENIVNLANVDELNVVDEVDEKEKVMSPPINSSAVTPGNISQQMLSAQTLAVTN